MAEDSERFYQQTTRRRFLQHAGWTAAGAVVSTLPVGRGDAAPQALRVGFVGNSFTWWGRMYGRDKAVPHVVKQLGGADKPATAITTEMVVGGGMGLKDHWEYGSWNSLKDDKWDYVVLQDKSMQPRSVKEIGAIPVLFYTWFPAEGHRYYSKEWAQGSPIKWHKAMGAAFSTAASATGAMVAPVSEAWLRAGAPASQSMLYAEDERHPSLQGVYLTACVIYRTLVGRPINAESVPSWISADVGRALQGIANDVCARQGRG
jgi:hypothetical protein